ncbi:SMODS domain-containing nucleotidyltransferase [Paenibacillus taichungensis]|uniref:SMODS domain-containing nucleotidyltransferase n=1 Tax=Paenibacillus taichungensis TaxID=484184 RepID=UPI002871AF6E|nr:nucleotidyltransferase domain-containing protein [Paenibacillus taichungensis]MDR9747644.1 nucleotidyltransferase domain-containing protein [Paenibacillus taichungensis]
MTIGGKFQTLIRNLRTTNHEVVSERYQEITRRLNSDFWGNYSRTLNSIYVGSYGRGTSIKGFSDVDMLMRLPHETYLQYNSYSYNGQSALLQKVRSSIAQKYPNTDVSGDGQVVVVRFVDGIKFEVVPAFIKTDNSYTYPDSNNAGRWRTCDPIPEINAINESNNQYKKKVKHLVRMTKAWKAKHNVPISGMLIETLAMQFMDDWEYNDMSYEFYDWMFRDFLKFLSNRNRDQRFWIARGSGQQVYRTGLFEPKATAGYKIAMEAADTTNDIYWKQLFGSFYTG